MIIVWQIVMIFKMSYSVFVLFTGIEPTQAPPEDSHLRGGSLLAGKDKKNDSNQQQELSFFYSFFKEKGPRMAVKVLCDGPFASDYVTGVGFW